MLAHILAAHLAEATLGWPAPTSPVMLAVFPPPAVPRNATPGSARLASPTTAPASSRR